MSERMNELYTLTQKAQKMEMINEELSLNLYLEIFEKYTPKISKTYESAIRLLEKRQRLSEALAICDKAIELIRADEVSGIAEKFETTKIRLERKIKELEPEVTGKNKKGFQLKKQHFLFAGLIILLIFALLKFTTPFDDLEVDLEGKDSLDNGSSVFNETTESPDKIYPVTDEMIDFATTELKKNTEVKEAIIMPQEDTLGIAIIVLGGTSTERAQELAEIYLKALSGIASTTYDELKAPSRESLGELYDFYKLVITVGTSVKEEDYIATGQKALGAQSIYWK